MVSGVECARGDECEDATKRSRQSHRGEEIDPPGAVAHQRAVRPHETPGRVPLFLCDLCEELLGGPVLEREEGKLTVAVEPGDDTRRPAAEASLVVVEEERTTLHQPAGR